MKKIRLPQPYAQMVVCGAIKSIPNIFKDPLINSERIYVYADYFESEWLEGFNVENPLHQRAWNEAILGNIPDELYPYNCFIGCVVVSPKEDTDDKWIPGCNNYLRVKSAYEFKNSSYVDDFNVSNGVLAETKVKNKKLNRMTRNGSRLYVPVGEHTWEMLKYPGTARNVFLFWEEYMKGVSAPPYLDDEIDDINDIVFHHNGQNKCYDCDLAGWNVRTFGHKTDKNGKVNPICAFIFGFNIEFEIDDNLIARPLKEYVNTILSETDCSDNNLSNSDVEKCETHYLKEEFKNPWPRFISVPMGGQNKWRRH